jgi:hypothetical protein
MGTIIGRTVMPQDASTGSARGPERKVAGYRNNIRAAKLGLPMWMDRWDGYPAARSRLLKAAQAADADLVMLAGDSHNAWAYALSEGGKPAGVEFAGHSVTSGGAEGDFGADPKVVAQGFMAANPELKWADTSQRGYMMIEVTPQRVTGEWLFMRTIKARDTALAGTHRMHGSNAAAHDRSKGSILIVVKAFDRHRAPPNRPVLITDRKGRIVQEDVPVVLELDDAGVDREAVFARAGELATIGPRPCDRGRGRVGNVLVPLGRTIERGVCQIVESAVLVQPRPFLEMRRGDLDDGTIDLRHVRL